MTNAETSPLAIARERTYKILYILSLCLVVSSIVILWNNPILHYQLSPYSGVPVTAWICLFISFFLTSYAMVSSQAGKTGGANRWFLTGLFMIVLIAAVLLLFPYIRGAWNMENADALSHVTMTGEVLALHHTDNIYPPLHFLAASLVLTTNISAYDVITFIGILFYLLYILWIYCLSRVVLKDKIMITLAVIGAATFQPGRIATIPYYLSLMILPLVITFYLTRHKSMSHSITCLILLSMLVFFHPLTGLILMFCLIGMELLQYLQNSWAHRDTTRQQTITRAEYSAAAFFTVGFLAWMVYENIFLFAGQIGRFIEAITSIVRLSEYQYFLVDFPILGITGWDFVNLFLKMYGHNVIFLVLTLIAVFWVYKKARSGTALEYEHRLFSLSGFVVISAVIMLVALVRPSGIIFSIPRLTFILTVMTPIFAAYTLYYIHAHFRDKIIQRFRTTSEKLKEILTPLPVLTLLCTAFILMTFMIYPSPHVKISSLQFTKAERAGVTWLLDNTRIEGHNVEAYGLGTNARFTEVVASISRRPIIEYAAKLGKKLPDHMGYDSYDTMGDYFGSIQLPTATGFELLEDGYVTLTRERMIRAIELYAPLGWLSQDDLDRFYSDKTVNQVYSNYEYFVFWVPLSSE
jgi:hypothetical protein